MAVCRRSDGSDGQTGSLQGASFQTENGRKTLICFPSYKHTAFYFPSPAKGWRSAWPQTGEMTTACHFCLQILNFLQMGGRSTFHRKVLRISDVRELWAMKRILSLHSREGNVLHAFHWWNFSILVVFECQLIYHTFLCSNKVVSTIPIH